VEKKNGGLSIRRQCEILSLNRSSLYFEHMTFCEKYQDVLIEMDKIYMEFPIYGSRRMSRELKRRGYTIGRHRVRHLMRLVEMEAIYPRKRLTYPDKDHEVYPYLL